MGNIYGVTAFYPGGRLAHDDYPIAQLQRFIDVVSDEKNRGFLEHHVEIEYFLPHLKSRQIVQA